MTPTENVLALLDSPRRRQPGQWSAKCPAHEDRGPSLSVRETPEGAVLLHCFAGCAVADVVAALGLDMQALFPPREKPARTLPRTARLLTAGQALELLAQESMLIAVAAGNIARGMVLADPDRQRLMIAAGRANWLYAECTRGAHACA